MVIFRNLLITLCIVGLSTLPLVAAQDLGESLAYAVINGDVTAVESLLSQGADPNFFFERQGSPVLNIALTKGHPAVVKALLAAGADVNSGSLFQAVRARDIDIVKLLLSHGGDPNAGAARGDHILHMAAGSHPTEIVEALIAAGADVNAMSGSQVKLTPLMAALVGYGSNNDGNPETVKVIIAAGADLNAKDSRGRTAAYYVLGTCNFELIKVWEEAIDQEVTVDASPRLSSCLVRAAKGGKTSEVMEWLERGADPNFRDREGLSPLYWAAGYGEIPTLEALIAHGAEVNAVGVEGKSDSALIHAIRRGRAENAEALLSAGADVDITGRGRGTALSQAARIGNLHLVDTLLAKTSDADARNKALFAALNVRREGALKVKQYELVEALIARGADNLNEALLMKASGDDVDMVKLLIAAGADVNWKRFDGASPLQWAKEARFGDARIIDVLVAAGAVDDKPLTVSSVRMLLTCAIGYQTGHPNTGFPVDVTGLGPAEDNCINQGLVDASTGEGQKNGYKFTYRPTNPNGNVNTGFEVTAAPSECDRTGRRTFFSDESGVLRFTNETGCPQADRDSPRFGVTVEAREDTKTETPKRNDSAAVRQAAASGDVEKLRSLKASGNDLNAKGSNGWTPLMAFSMEGNTGAVKALLAAGVTVDSTMNVSSHGRPETASALMYAASMGHTEIVRVLVEAGANPHYRSADGNTARGLAERFRHLEVVEYLKTAEANVSPPASDQNEGKSLLNRDLFEAVLQDSTSQVQSLLEAGADPNAKDQQRGGMTPLMLATGSGYTRTAQILVEAGADLNARGDEIGGTALTIAAMMGRTYVVAALLEAGADVNAKDRRFKTALLWAVEGGYRAIVESLVEAGADVNAKDRRFKKTALLWAAERGYTAIVESLVEAGADPHATGVDGVSAADLAERGGHARTVEYLAKIGVKVGGGNDSRRTARNEGWAVGSVRMLVTCAIGYQTGHPDIGFPGDVTGLGPAGDNCINQGLVDASTGEGKIQGYRFTYRPINPNGNVNVGFEVTAAPSECDRTGRRTYFSDESGVLRFTNEAGCPQADVKSSPL